MGRDESAVWGECRGSGAKPYRIRIDPSGPAFKCSCPSRKFPCKHSLALFLLLAEGDVRRAEPPPWVVEWLQERTKRAERKEQRKKKKAPDPKAQARRAAAREEKVAAGIAEASAWLNDVVRQGLATAQAQPFSFWEETARRMVDAQAPGIARRIRELGSVAASGRGWESRLLQGLARLHLLLEGYGRLDGLPDEVRADVRARVGFATPQEHVLRRQPVRDRWAVLAQRAGQEEQLQVRRTWLWGEQTGRPALVLGFGHGGRPPDVPFATGTRVVADLCFYEGGAPLRALVQHKHADVQPLRKIPHAGALETALETWSGMVARDPWVERWPVAVADVVPIRKDRWWIRDAGGRRLPLERRCAHAWHLLALSGGHPVTLFGEWDGEQLRPLSVSHQGAFYSLDTVESTALLAKVIE